MKELLGLVAYAGETHAAYPSADATLCGLYLRGTVAVSSEEPPSCSVCEEAARLFDSIDNSAPARWYGRLCPAPVSYGPNWTCDREVHNDRRYCTRHTYLEGRGG